MPDASRVAYDGFISYSHAADDQLAPRLQAGLQRFAKPWWQRRALRIFRDESSLAANPHLWSSITDALDEAGWFVLLLSPDAAGSEWVNQEIGYWLEHKEADRIIPVVTAGEFGWDGSDVTGDCVPEALRGVFGDEPRWVDARGLGDPETLDLQNPEFAAVVADLASPLRGVPKDELASEEVRQHKRTVRTAWAAAAVVAVLGVVAVGFGVQSSENAAEAERQATVAALNEAEAETQREVAEANATEAELQAQRAETQAAIAKARELAASSINAAGEDAQLALLLAVQAVRSLPPGEPEGPNLEAALRGAMSADRLLARYDELEEPSGTALDVSHDGSLLAFSVVSSGTLEVLDTETLEPLWRYTEDSNDGFEWVAFSSEGEYVVLSVADERYTLHEGLSPEAPKGEPDARFIVFESETGEVVHTEVVDGACAINVFPGGWREDLGLLGFGFVGCGSEAEFEGTFRILETDTWSTVLEREAADLPHVVFGGEGTLAALMSGMNSEPVSAIVDTEGWEVVRSDLQTAQGSLSPDGTTLVSLEGLGARLEDAATGEVLDRLPTGSLFIATARFSSDGQLVMDLIGDETVVIDPSSGAEVSRLRTGRAEGGAVLNDGKLYTAGNGVVSVWDQAGVSQGDLNTVPLGLWVNANSIFQAEGTVVAHVYDFDTDRWALFPVASDGSLGTPIDATDLWEMTPVVGNRVLVQRYEETEEGVLAGPIEVIDLGTGESEVIAGCWMDAEEASLHEPCPDGVPNPSGIFGMVGSRSGDEVLIFDELQPGDTRDTWVSIWDTSTWEEVDRLNLGPLDAWGNQLRESALTSDYLVLFNRRTGTVDVLDRGNLESVTITDLPPGVAKMEHDPVRNALWLTDNADRVMRLDLDRLVVESVSEEGTEGFVRGLAPSPSGDRVAIGSTDGAVRIYSIDGELLHLIPLPNPSDAFWLDDQHLVVGTANGPWTTITLDPAELAEVARSRLRRAFTPTECQFHGIDPCPTLSDMRDD